MNPRRLPLSCITLTLNKILGSLALWLLLALDPSASYFNLKFAITFRHPRKIKRIFVIGDSYTGEFPSHKAGHAGIIAQRADFRLL